MKFIVLLGRLLYSWIFILAGFSHFSGQAAGYAANQGVPFSSFLVPASGVLALLGGLSILLGYKAKVGAWLLVLFLVPVTLMMHNFWAVSDPMARMMQLANFNKNIGLLGCALIIAYFGSGALSVDSVLGSHRISNKFHMPSKFQHS